MKFTPVLGTLLLCLFSIGLYGQNAEISPERLAELNKKKSYRTDRILTKAPSIDGLLDEKVWDKVEWGSDFVQIVPEEGKPPSQETSFKILYDDKFLYVGFRCHDDEPDKIVKRMSRRDGFEGDWVEINIDSYNDKRTAFSFTISASGVKGDEFISDNGFNWDESWNPIWFAATNIDSLGWTAEIKIPFSQIRYGLKDEHTWGIQFTRRDFRAGVRNIWQYISRTNSNWVSEFGNLEGLKGLKPQKQIEVQPYAVAQTESFERQEGNPFATGSDNGFNAGLDGKIGVTGDLTLDFTINPDFGQVEADPAAINLDGFRIFFREQRPFFIENRNLFDYQVTSSEAGGNFTSDNVFYSRRIGRAPSGYPSLNDGEFADVPVNTTILGAAKFSGKTKKGTGIAVLESVTAKEYATIENSLGQQRKEVVEPLTNYFVSRVTQDFNEGQTVIGGIFTATQRDLDGTGLDFLRKSAYTSGLDVMHFWKDRTYYIQANTIMSRVNGSQESILNTQTAFEHYFQRPDADYVSVDSSATSLMGTGGTVNFGKRNGNFIFETGATWRSPELELNDVGFLLNTDEINHYLWAGYRINEPFSIFQRLSLNANHYYRWDFGGENLYQAWNTNLHTQFKNFWGMGMGVTYEGRDISNTDLRGGPALRRSQGLALWGYIYTDNRKKVQGFVNYNIARGFEKDNPRTVESAGIFTRVTYQPTNAMSVSLAPNYNSFKRKAQFVSNLGEIEGRRRYVVGNIDQDTWSMTIRLNYNITPNLTIQYYGQPFISRGRYDNFKDVANSMAEDFNERFVKFTDNQIAFDGGRFSVDEDLDGIVDFDFSDPDFNFMQWRSNMVARWEYVPGSELFLVWTQGSNASGDPSERIFPSLQDNLFSRKAHNIFLVKWTYRFLL
ncbi:MAG: DUF5916 domain-containing protein [Bacteroidota bacterium]